MIFLKNSLKKMILNKKSLLLFALSFFILNISTVSAYYDEAGNEYRLVFEDTPLRNFVTRDFAITYQNNDYLKETIIAKFTDTSKSGTYTYNKGFDKREDLFVVIYETSQEYQNQYNVKYIAIVEADYVAGNTNAIYPTIYKNKKLVRDITTGKHSLFVDRYQDRSGFNPDKLNFDINNSNVLKTLFTSNGAYVDSGGLIIKVKTDGSIERINDIYNRESHLVTEINSNACKNVIYSSVDIIDREGNVLVEKEEFKSRKVTSNYSLTCDDTSAFIYNLNFLITDLEINDKIKIYKDSKLIKEEVVKAKKDNYYIEITNADSNKYKIEVYDIDNNLIHTNEFNIVVDLISFNEDDDALSLIDKTKQAITEFKRSLDFIYQGWNVCFNSLNPELKIGIIISIIIIILSILFKIIIK